MSFSTKIIIAIILDFILTGCFKYVEPTSGPISVIKLKSNALYTDVKVDFCSNLGCDSSSSLGELIGKRASPSTANEILLKLPADTDSYIKFRTEKEVRRLTDKPKKRTYYYEAFGYVSVRSEWITKGTDVSCETMLHIKPVKNRSYYVTHDVDEKTEECSAKIEKDLVL